MCAHVPCLVAAALVQSVVYRVCWMNCCVVVACTLPRGSSIRGLLQSLMVCSMAESGAQAT